MEVPRVLVGVVTYDGKHYIFPKNYDIVSNLSYPNYDFMIVDNSRGTSYVSKLRREGYKNVVHIERPGNSRDALSASQNLIRERFINGSYDFLMLIESDLLPPKDIIQKLLRHNKPVTGVIYFIGNEKVKVPCIFYKEGQGTRLNGVETTPDGKKIVYEDQALSVINKGLIKVHGCGFGCTLFRRDVIQRFKFWTDERFDNKHSDVYMFMDIDNAGIPVFVDSNIVVPHFQSDWSKVADK